LQCQVDNNGKNGGADDANGRALCVEGDHRKRSGGEGDNGDDDGCLSDWLGLISKAKFMSGASSKGQMAERARRKECVKALS